MSVWTNVGDFFKGLWADIEPTAENDLQAAEAFVEAGVTDLSSQLSIQGMKIVTDGVAAAETTGGSAAAKLAAAQAAIMTDLAAAVISVPQHVINFAIEAAVAQMNAAKAAAAQPAPAADPAATPAS